MNRREFLRLLAQAATAAAAAKPFIFDVGKNVWRRDTSIVWYDFPEITFSSIPAMALDEIEAYRQYQFAKLYEVTGPLYVIQAPGEPD